MKVAVLLACTCAVLSTKRVTCAAIKAPLDIISLDDISEGDRKFIDFLDSTSRSKRSGEDALYHLKETIGQGIKAKLAKLAKGTAGAVAGASAGAISGFSKGSSGGGHSYHHHHYPETYDHKSFDFWSLKKSILNTLLQAVKAIKGGVIAIKGQLIKGSGYLISAKGKLISAKGEAITDLGKKIATSAVLSPAHHHHHHGYSADYHYHHSGSGGYGAPSAPGPDYEVPEHFHHHPAHHEDKPDSHHSGILILKKIPKPGDHGHSEEHKVPDFKAIGPSGPSLGTIVGKFFSASTSLKPGEPAPFGDTAPDHSYHDAHHDHDHPSPSHDDYHSSSHDHLFDSPHDHHHDSPHDHHHDSPHDHHHDTHDDYESAPTAHSSDVSDHSKPSGFGSPFEEAPAFLNLHEYTSESKTKLTHYPKPDILSFKKPEHVKVETTSIKYDEIRPLSSFSNAGFDAAEFLKSYDKPKLFVGTLSDKPNVDFPPYQDSKSTPAIKPTLGTDTAFPFGGFPGGGGASSVKYMASPSVGPQMFPQAALSALKYPISPIPFSHQYGFVDNVPSPSHKIPHKRPTRSKHTHKHKFKRTPSYSMFRSVKYIGPNGPKRL